MLLTKKEKEDMVRDLLEKGYTIRKVSEQAHVSFSFISEIKRKITGEKIDKKNKKEKSLSISSQAFKLFLKGKSLVDVSIILNISKEVTVQIHLDYLTLQNMEKVAAILKEYRNNLPAFLKWFTYIKKDKTKAKDIQKAIDNINKINVLEQQKENLQREVQSIQEDRDCYLRSLESIKKEFYK